MKFSRFSAIAIIFFVSVTLNAAGTFRFLTQTLPTATTNGNYNYRVVTANAADTVTFSIIANPENLPTGMSLDSDTGYITGIPDSSGNYNFRIRATDGTTTINLNTLLKVSSAGGGGNPGVHFKITSLTDGRVGTAYTDTLTAEGGTGPFTYMTSGIPGGLSTNGQTGVVSGTPTEAGTFMVTVTALDQNDDTKSTKILPLEILPAGNDFQFTTQMLNNGEVGTAYSDQYATANAQGAVTYSASGLPEGLTCATTGAVSGTPTESGTFEVTISANDTVTTISTNLLMWIAANSTSDMYWAYTGLPLAIRNVAYGQQPDLEVVALNGTTVTYSATGLPTGITYDTNTGVLAGTPTSSIGIYPVTFTATDSANGDSITLSADLILLDSTGGDVKDIVANFFVLKQAIKSGVAGKDSWQTTIIYNDDRTNVNIYDPATDTFSISIEDHSINLAAGDMTKKSNVQYFYKNEPTEQNPVRQSIKFAADKQRITVKTSKDTISEAVPGTYLNKLAFGNIAFRVEEYFDEKGKFNPVNGYKNAVFVVDRTKLKVVGANKDQAAFGMYMMNPTFSYTNGDTVQLVVRNSTGTEIINKVITNFVTATTSVDSKTGVTVYKFKRAEKDASETNILSSFKYETRKGKMDIKLKNVSLGLTKAEENITVEVTIRDKTYTTGITVFDPRASGNYSEKKPKQ